MKTLQGGQLCECCMLTPIVSLKLGDRYVVHLSSLEDYLKGRDFPPFDVVVSNPPYIPTHLIHDLQAEVRG